MNMNINENVFIYVSIGSLDGGRIFSAIHSEMTSVGLVGSALLSYPPISAREFIARGNS